MEKRNAENPYEGSQAPTPQVGHSTSRIPVFRRRMLVGAAMGAVLFAVPTLALLYLVTWRAGEGNAGEQLLRSLREWSNAYAFGTSPLIVVPLLYGVAGAVVGATLGMAYHLMVCLLRWVIPMQ